jgi:allantoinase
MVYERDFIGYAGNPPSFSWPGGARLALSLVFNYEEGSEHSVKNDGIVETIGEFGPVETNVRDVGMESAYEYGQRVAIWRILKFLAERKIKATFFATAKALDTNREAAKTIVRQGHEICDHGYRWTEHYRMTYEEERKEIERSVELIKDIIGVEPKGFYAREPSENTLAILSEMKNFIYDSDSYSDDLPYFDRSSGMLILPYTPDANDFHFLSPMHRFSNSADFLQYLIDTFDVLYAESGDNPVMMSVGLHVRISGRPGRFRAVRDFVDYVSGKKDVWIARRDEIAGFWLDTFGDRR